MATISQRIELDGADEIRRQLEAIGKAGTLMGAELEAASVKVAQKLDQVVRSVARVEASFASVGRSASAFRGHISNVGDNFGRLESAFTRAVRNVTLFTGAVTAAGLGLGKLVSGATGRADEIGEIAQGIALTTDEFQRLAAVALDSGVSQTQFAQAVGLLNKKLAEQRDPAIAAGSALTRLGISAKTPGDALLQLADRFAQIPNA